jgi:cysteine dioxygenase
MSQSTSHTAASSSTGRAKESPTAPRPRLSASVASLFNDLNQYNERIPLDALIRRVAQTDIALDDIMPYAQFDPKRYRRNLMHEGPAYQALILCWRGGQRSPIHDHTGSSCCVKVLQGVMTETIFERKRNGMIYATRSTEQRAGETIGSQDADIHQVSNLQEDGSPLITLHIYSPPLLTMNVYSLTDNTVTKFDDPVHDFCMGGGI